MEEEQKEVKEEPKALNMIEQIKALRDEIKTENDRRAELLRQEQELHAVRMMSGTASAGEELPEDRRTDAEKKRDAAAEFFKGSEIEKAIKKHG